MTERRDSLYEFIIGKRQDSEGLKAVMEETARHLVQRARGIDPFTGQAASGREERLTLAEAPIAMVGQVQSGKTRAYLGVMAKCLDDHFDIAVILTKNNRVLGRQTYERVRRDFSKCDSLYSPIGSRQLQVLMITEARSGANRKGFNRGKLVIVAIKDDTHVRNVKKFLAQGAQRKKNVLIIDDEADVTSINYNQHNEPAEVMRTLMEIRALFNDRTGIRAGCLSLLQVTATPAALFLQRNESDPEDDYLTMQPDYTVLLEPHSDYVGGEHFFERSKQRGTLESHLIEIWPKKCLDIIGKPSQNWTFDDVSEEMNEGGFVPLKRALLTYLMGGVIRSSQEEESDRLFTPQYASSCLIHTDSSQKCHLHQMNCVLAFLDWLKDIVMEGRDELSDLLRPIYDNLSLSIRAGGLQSPDYDVVEAELIKRVVGGLDARIVIVNSAKKDLELDDPRAEFSTERSQDPFNSPLELTATYNFFIGGDSFTRGVTLSHLLVTIYGREATQDSDNVTQHARWFGARSKEDLAVTRVYMSQVSLKKQREAYLMDLALRDQVRRSEGRLEVVTQARNQFSLEYTSDARRHTPTHDRIVGRTPYQPDQFDLADHEIVDDVTSQITARLQSHLGETSSGEWRATREEVFTLIELMNRAFEFEEDLDVWHHEVAKAMITISIKSSQDPMTVVYLGEQSFHKDVDHPLSYLSYDRAQPYFLRAREEGALLLISKQVGSSEMGWSSDAFYWPTLLSSEDVISYIFYHSDKVE